MSKTANSSWETTGKPIVVLTVISLIVSLLLALVNGMTAPVIKENTRRTTLAAYVSVMPSVSDAATLEEVTDYTTANVTGVVTAPSPASGWTLLPRPRASAPMCPPMTSWHSSTAWTAPRTL